MTERSSARLRKTRASRRCWTSRLRSRGPKRRPGSFRHLPPRRSPRASRAEALRRRDHRRRRPLGRESRPFHSSRRSPASSRTTVRSRAGARALGRDEPRTSSIPVSFLQLRDAVPVVVRDLRRAASAAATHARLHARTPTPGRTWPRQATPITFGPKAARWLDARSFARWRARVGVDRRSCACSSEALSGTPRVARRRRAERLFADGRAPQRLPVPAVPRHAHRDRPATLALLRSACRAERWARSPATSRSFRPGPRSRRPSNRPPTQVARPPCRHKRNPVRAARVLSACGPGARPRLGDVERHAAGARARARRVAGRVGCAAGTGSRDRLGGDIDRGACSRRLIVRNEAMERNTPNDAGSDHGRVRGG
mgnify:CR=1 FL=1